MTQIAKVKQIVSPGVAEISVTRQGACGHNCEECGDSCMMAKQPDMLATAQNPLGAQKGDRVLVESASAPLLGIAAAVYLVPMALLIFGFLMGQYLELTQGLCILAGGICFALSMVAVCLLDRRVRKEKSVQFTIIEIRNS